MNDTVNGTSQKRRCIIVTGLLSQPSLGRIMDTGETGFAIIANIDAQQEGTRLDVPVTLFMAEDIANSLAHAIIAGHLPGEGCKRG